MLSTPPDHPRPLAETVTTFRYADRQLVSDHDSGTLTAIFTYALEDALGEAVVTATETIEFPAPNGAVSPERHAAVDRLLAHACLLAGLSYYKMAAPAAVEIEPAVRPEGWSVAEIEFHRLVLARGFGEFCHENGLDPDLRPSYGYLVATAVPPVTGLAPDRGPLVPVGGGKDSCVSLELLRSASIEPTIITVNRYPVIQDVIDASGLPDLLVRRNLDLAALKTPGAMNGHVPITTILSFVMAAAAVLHGFDALVLSNERSASEGNVVYRGVEINHQWSKSEEAERAIAEQIASIAPELAYFSLLRPMSELAIVDRFARTCDRYLDSFSSCNAAFRLDPARRTTRWCGTCPKCQFVYLALATALPRATIESIWGAELFTTSRLEGFRELLGLTDLKPFECVGEFGECRVAVRRITESAEWDAHPVIAELAAQVRAAGLWPSDAEVDSVYALSSTLAPEHYARLVLVEEGRPSGLRSAAQ